MAKKTNTLTTPAEDFTSLIAEGTALKSPDDRQRLCWESYKWGRITDEQYCQALFELGIDKELRPREEIDLPF